MTHLPDARIQSIYYSFPESDECQRRNWSTGDRWSRGLDEGDQTINTCFKYDFVAGWHLSNPIRPRCRHVSWDVEGSLYLIGGSHNGIAIPSYQIVLPGDGGATEHETQFQPE